VVELSSGINPGDTIIVSGVLFVRPNALVHIRTVKKQALESLPDSNLVSK